MVIVIFFLYFFFFFNDTATTEIYTLSLHDALPIWLDGAAHPALRAIGTPDEAITSREDVSARSEEHTSELQSLRHLVCRLLLEKKKTKKKTKNKPSKSHTLQKTQNIRLQDTPLGRE